MSLFRHFAYYSRKPNFTPYFNAPENATESDKRDLMKELDTMKQLKPHPYVIKLLGCVTESGMLWLCGSNFAVHILPMILLCNTFSSLIICFDGRVTASQLNTTNNHRIW